MAETSRKLVLKFKDSEGATTTHSINNVSSELEETDVKTLMDAMITNTRIYAKVLVSKLSADVVVTDTTSIDIDEEP